MHTDTERVPALPPDLVPHTRRVAWERATAIPMAALALLFLAAYAWHVLDAGRHPWIGTWTNVLDVTVWALFAVDYCIRLRLSTNRRRFVRRNWLDLVAVLLPPLRPLRLLRAVLLVLDAADRRSRFQSRTRMSVFVGAGSLLLLFVCSLALYDAERDAEGANVTSFGDAVWWAAVSVTTVGYGDRYPVTAEGRLVALLLMTIGIGLISFAIGTTTSWVVDKFGTVEKTAERTEGELSALIDEIRSLRAEVTALREQSAGPPRSR
ncbi:potassium channel family protein [Nocardia sp. IFM 10818]